jgi:hypothetical protein
VRPGLFYGEVEDLIGFWFGEVYDALDIMVHG